MRRMILGSLLLASCTKLNPGWDEETTAGPASTPDPASTSGLADPTTTAPASTSGADATATTAVDPTTGAVVGTGTTGDATITDATTTDATTTAPAMPHCEASETVELELSLVDAGVVPASFQAPCPWNGGTCPILNFGTTQFYRLVNEPMGTNVALLRFDATSLAAAAAAADLEYADVLGARLAFVVWEPRPAPEAPYTFAIHALSGANADFDEGNHDATDADDGDSNAECKRREAGNCVAWDGGSALAGSSKLGELHVTADLLPDADEDESDGEYHARVFSELLPGAVKEFSERPPAFAVTLQSPRTLAQTETGIKLREAPWTDPTLLVEVCTEWSP